MNTQVSSPYVSKDVYTYIMNFADDRTILNMLSVNKDFNNEEFFKKVMQRKYPLLIKYKKGYKTWKQFYIGMIYYISKLYEKFDIPYINVEEYNPEDLYFSYKNISLGLRRKRFKMLKSDFKKQIKYKTIEEALEVAARGDYNVTKYLIENNEITQDALNVALYKAMFKYMYDKTGYKKLTKREDNERI